MASMSSADPVAYVIQKYLETYPDHKPINSLDFRAAVTIVTELVREQLTRETSQKESGYGDGQPVRRRESRSSSILASVFTAARQYVLTENTTSEEGLEQVMALQNGASMYGRMTCDLLRIGFPFATVSPELSRTCLINKSSLSTVVNQKLEEKYIEGDLRPGTNGWTEIETLVDGVSGDVIGKMLLGYYNANRQQVPLRDRFFHILLKMTVWQEHALPQVMSGEACDLKGCFEDSLKSFEYSKHPNPLKLIEIVLGAFSQTIQTNDGFRVFVLQMLKDTPFADWPNKERVLITYFELRRGQLNADAAFLASSIADGRTAIIGQNILDILFLHHLDQRECTHHLSQLMHHLPLIPDGWIESVFRRSYPKFNVLCQDFYFTPPCVRRVNFNSYSPVLVIGDLVIGLYEGRNKSEISETFWTCVAYHIKTEELVWTQPIDLKGVQSWMILNTPFGVAIPKQDSRGVEFYDVETGVKKGCLDLPRIYNPMDRLHCTPGGYIYYFCKKDLHLFVTNLSSSCFSNPTIWQMKYCASEMTGFSEHYILFKNTDSVELIAPNDIYDKYCFLGCEHLSLFGTTLVQFNKKDSDKMEVIIRKIEEGSVFTLSESEPRRYTVSFGHVQNVSMAKDMLIYSTLEGIYFVNLQNDAIKEIKREFSPYYTPLLIDSETGIIWMWDRTKRCLYRSSQEGFDSIGELTSRDHVRLLFARDEMLYMIG